MIDHGDQELSGLSRRRFLQGSALAGVAAFLAACGTKGTASSEPSVAASASTAAAASASASVEPSVSAVPSIVATPSAELNWATWSYYMDVDANDPTKHPTLDAFKAKYGTTVHYQESIEANEDFVASIKDALNTGKDTGWDIITLTDWMAARLIRLGWVEAFDPANVPNLIANIKDVYKAVDWDPDVKHHAPWRSGTTGLGFDSSKAGDVTSLAALFTVDPRWKGKVEYLTEMRDAVGLAMLYAGLDPSKPTREGCDKAVAAMQKAKADGLIRDVKGQSYTEDLKSGDAVLAMAWSGDMVQAQADKATLKYNLPTEGGMLWTDNTMIPKGAAHKGTAELLINYYYDPEVSAKVSEQVDYISPVKGSDEILVKAKPDEANNPLLNPPADWIARLHIFGALNEADEAYFNKQFAKVIGVA
jgi:spermidine/putrescine transport system substrate-binding protein